MPDVAIEYLIRNTPAACSSTRREAAPLTVAVATFRFREVRGPSIVRHPGGADLLAEGRVWAERASGEIVRTELISRDRHSSGTSVVDFRVDPRLSIRVPVKMTERYEMRGELVEAVATYTNFRTFAVTTTEKLTKPPQ